MVMGFMLIVFLGLLLIGVCLKVIWKEESKIDWDEQLECRIWKMAEDDEVWHDWLPVFATEVQNKGFSVWCNGNRWFAEFNGDVVGLNCKIGEVRNA